MFIKTALVEGQGVRAADRKANKLKPSRLLGEASARTLRCHVENVLKRGTTLDIQKKIKVQV